MTALWLVRHFVSNFPLPEQGQVVVLIMLRIFLSFAVDPFSLEIVSADPDPDPDPHSQFLLQQASKLGNLTQLIHARGRDPQIVPYGETWNGEREPLSVDAGRVEQVSIGRGSLDSAREQNVGSRDWDRVRFRS
ncbi:hypothetical protein QBC39DRAFT_344546 [Podospora conica]|nr:hypothetical protein QBC39DRAFT_344546 [Schizothecium conicum]